MGDHHNAISTFAINSRLFLLIFQFAANLLLPDHDANVFYPPTEKSLFTVLDHIVHLVFAGLLRWDALYFTHIMQHGYTYENCVAFFPFYPIVVSSIAKLLSLTGLLHISSCVLVIGVLVNCILFVFTATSLYRLGKIVLGSSEIAFNAAMLFCINPASIFMIAPYSEILYSFLLIQALLNLKGGSRIFASLFIALSVFTRSNGMVGIGFIIHDIVRSFIARINSLDFKNKDKWIQVFVCVFKTISETVLCIVISLAPFFAYQFYIYQKFCRVSSGDNEMPTYLHDYGRLQRYKLVGDIPSSWCKEAIPLSYSYIQKHHWGVGFLKYYKFKQIPNFLLAAPVIALSLRACLHFFKQRPQQFYYLGFWNGPILREHEHIEFHNTDNSDDQDESLRIGTTGSGSEGHFHGIKKIQGTTAGTKVVKRQRNHGETVKAGEIDSGERDDKIQEPHRHDKSAEIVVYVFHLLGLTVFGCFFVHIQVLTRLLFSSSPLLMWYCGALMCKKKSSVGTTLKQAAHLREKEKDRASSQDLFSRVLNICHFDFIANVVENWTCYSLEYKAVFVYFITYCLLGTIMFSNFLPWT